MALSLEIQVYLDAIVIVMLIRNWFVPSQLIIIYWWDEYAHFVDRSFKWLPGPKQIGYRYEIIAHHQRSIAISGDVWFANSGDHHYGCAVAPVRSGLDWTLAWHTGYHFNSVVIFLFFAEA